MNEWLPAVRLALDVFLTVCSGWLAGRVPTLAELHNLAVRRERRRISARIADGIASLMIVVGIARTLWTIHPILKDIKGAWLDYATRHAEPSLRPLLQTLEVRCYSAGQTLPEGYAPADERLKDPKTFMRKDDASRRIELRLTKLREIFP